MITSRKLSLIAAAAVALAIPTLSSAPALAADGSVVRDTLVGSMPAPDSPVIAGVAPGGSPWVAGPSAARVGNFGKTDVIIRGLIVPDLASNPVPSVVATLVCGDMVADSTVAFDLSLAGNGALIDDHISVPAGCEAPVLLIQPATNLAVYIASTTP